MTTNAPPKFTKSNICNNCELSLSSFWARKQFRSHHCRACGNTFCQKCSQKTSSIPQFGFDMEVRVCDSCYDQIQISLNPPFYKTDGNSSPIRQSMFELDDEEALNLAVAISQSEAEMTNRRKHITRIQVTRKNPFSESKTQCPICLEDRLEWALEICGHVICGDCLPKIEDCPICRQKPTGAMRIYISS